MRLVSLRYGADLVYSEEIVDKRIVSAVRVPNGTIHHDTILYCFYSGGLDSNRSIDCVSTDFVSTDCVSTDFCVPMDCHDLAAILHSVDFISRTGDSVVFGRVQRRLGKWFFKLGQRMQYWRSKQQRPCASLVRGATRSRFGSNNLSLASKLCALQCTRRRGCGY